MKKLILCFTTMLLLFASCEKGCIEKRPKDLKPIDWENYNDVKTVFWNTTHLCSETINLQSDTIKISGWCTSYDMLALCDDPNDIDRLGGDSKDRAHPIIHIHGGLSHYILDTSDIRKKVFLKGKLVWLDMHVGFCCTIVPRIENIYDIYFE